MFGGDGIGIKNLQLALARWTALSVDVGVATGGGNTTVDDTSKDWPINKWAGGDIRIVKANGQEYTRTIASNLATQITFAALPGGVVVAAGDIYAVKNIAAPPDVTDRWNRQLGQIDIARVLGVALSLANPLPVRSVAGGAFDISYSNLSQMIRWRRQDDPFWVHAAEVVAPDAGTALVTRPVTAGTTGYIYGFFISAQEANDFLINWTSGAVARSLRFVFGGGGVIQDVEPVPLNEALSADAGTNITITNVNAGGVGRVYQARLLYMEA